MPAGKTTQETGKTGLIVKVSVIVLALGGAGYLAFLRGDPETEQLDTAESAVAYVCKSCGNGMMLTPAAFDEMLKQGAVGVEGEERSGRAALRCPKCQKVSVVRGHRCPKDGAFFPIRTQTGEMGKCPKCGWMPTLP